MMCALRFTGSCWGAVLRAEPGHASAGEENPLPGTFLQPQSHAGLGGRSYTVSAPACLGSVFFQKKEITTSVEYESWLSVCFGCFV